jgi:hypothetical protein
VLLERWRLASEPQSAPPTNISWPGFYKARSARNSSAQFFGAILCAIL